MSVHGYGEVKKASERVAAALRDIAVLIGEPTGREVRLETGDTVVPGLGFNEDAEALAARAKDISQGLFKIIVLGEFKHGKSTLLNAMLGEKVLPAQAVPTTAVITVLVQGDARGVAVYETGHGTPRVVSWQDFEREFKLSEQDIEVLVNEKKPLDRFRHVEYAQIECHHRLCANGVKLIDSPGLGEHVSRTKVATNFLKQSQAVIFVLNATQILSKDEKEFIEQVLGRGRLNHVFFVVNRINVVEEDDPQQVGKIKEWVKHSLKHHFLDQQGRFDQAFYDRRVFFVDAKGALNARRADQVDEATLEATGVPALERELERFLSGGEKITAALESTVQVLTHVVGNARQRVARDKLALDQPLEELEKSRVQAASLLKELEHEKKEIEWTVIRFGNAIKEKVYADLVAYVGEMEETWPLEAEQYLKLERMTFTNLLMAAAWGKKDQELKEHVQGEVEGYLRAKFQEWSARVPVVVADDIEQMAAVLTGQVSDFQLKLDQLEDMLASGASQRPAEEPGSKISRALQLLGGVALMDASNVSAVMLGKSDWGSFVGRLLLDMFIYGALSWALGPVGFFAYLIFEGIHMSMQAEEKREKIRENIGRGLHESLRQQLVAKQSEIYQLVEAQFGKNAEALVTTLQRRVDEALAEHERIVARKQDASFSVEKEKQRLDDVGAKLLGLFKVVAVAAYGKDLTAQEVETLAEGRSLLLAAA